MKKKKRNKSGALAIMLAFLMIFTMIPQSAFAADIEVNSLPEFTVNSDTATTKAFKISSEESLRALAAAVKADDGKGTYNLSGVSFHLANDIMLSGGWTPISSVTYPADAFAGTFDGNGHTISGLNINATAANQGLFGLINGATIKNLNVEGNVTSSNSYVGGIVGKVQQGTIENCSFSGTVTSSKRSSAYAGGIVGGTVNLLTIEGCYNKATVTGYAGGILGYGKAAIKNCYNTGDIKGTNRAGGIIGQFNGTAATNTATNCYNIGKITLSSSSNAYSGGISGYNGGVSNCYWTNPETATGDNTGSVNDSEKIASPDGLSSNLGSAFIADANQVNNGYPILAWQAGAATVPKEPKIQITGSTSLIMQNNSTVPQTTLTVVYKDMDEEPEITWSLQDDNGVVTLEKPSNSSDANNIVIVKAKKPGKATVVASAAGGTYTDQCEITVYPVLTTVEIEGNVAVGETVKAKVNVLGGEEYDYENYPDLKIQWRYLTAEDYNNGNTGTSSYKNISGATGREFTVTNDLEGCYLSFVFTYDRESKFPNRPVKVKSAAAGILEADRTALTMDTSDIKEAKTLSLPDSGEKGSSISWSSSNDAVIASESGAVTLPETGISEVTLTAELSYSGQISTKTFTIKVYSKQAIAEEEADKELQLQKAVDSLGDYYKMYPVYGEDTNVKDILKADLQAKGHEGIDVSVVKAEEVFGDAGIADDGTITYFYTDPNTVLRPAWFGSYKVTFTLERDGATVSCEDVPVILYWDRDKVKETMTKEILDRVGPEDIKGENADLNSVSENLVLPKVVDGKMWTQISWTSSNDNVISISSEKQASADTLFEPYVGVVKPGAEDQKVTLTATFAFQRTNDVTGSEEPITMNKVYQVTVKAISEDQAAEIAAQLQAKLDAGFEKAGLTDAVTGAALTETDGTYTSANDIQLPTTRDFGVDGKYYPVVITTSDDELLAAPDVNNAARVAVYRPAVDAEDGTADITVTIYDKNTSVSASKTFTIKVPALTQKEVDDELELMEKVKSQYFEGIKGGNNNASDITMDLKAFQEAYLNDDGQLVWVYDQKDKVNHGIVPTAMDGWDDLEVWRLFKSSNAGVISHENLLVTRQKENKAVTVTSALSSETLGKYGALYKEDPEKYAAYKALESLYYQEVSANLIVTGTDPTQAGPVDEKLTVSFTLQGDSGQWLKATVKDLPEGTSAYEVFSAVLKENGYSFGARGSYIYSVTKPDGTTLAEKDHGKDSGWMYSVNGVQPQVYMSSYILKNNDNIVFFYTKDYTQEPGSAGWGDSTDSGPVITLIDEAGKTDGSLGKAVYNKDTGVLTITAADGYKVKDVLVNGVSKGALTEIKGLAGLTKNDKVTVVFEKEEQEPSVSEDEKQARIIKGVQATTIRIYSKSMGEKSRGKGWIRIWYKKSSGYKVDYYEVFRSKGDKKHFGKTAFYTTKKNGLTGWYKNTKALKKGTRYYYKIRGVRVIDGKKYYTQWSNTIYRIAK